MNLTKLSAQTFLFNVAGFMSRVVLGVLVARILSPTDKGLLTLIILYPSIFFILGHFNLGLSTIHYLGKKEYKKEEFAGNLLFFSAVISLTLLLIFFISYLFGGDYLYKNIPSKFLFLSMLVLPFNIFIYYFSSFFQGLGKINWHNIVNLLAQFMAPFLVLGFWFFWTQSNGNRMGYFTAD